MPTEKFPAGLISVELLAIEANKTYRIYANIRNGTLIPLCYVDKATADADPQGLPACCQREAKKHIRALLHKYAAEPETDG